MVSMNDLMDTMTTTAKKRTRRDYSRAEKAQILAECELPGASVAKVALAHGINANIVHTWRKLAREGLLAKAAATPGFLPLPLEAAPALMAEVGHITIELHRAGVSIKLNWPLTAATQLAAWTRELLR
jgi:transposase